MPRPPYRPKNKSEVEHLSLRGVELAALSARRVCRGGGRESFRCNPPHALMGCVISRNKNCPCFAEKVIRLTTIFFMCNADRVKRSLSLIFPSWEKTSRARGSIRQISRVYGKCTERKSQVKLTSRAAPLASTDGNE